MEGVLLALLVLAVGLLGLGNVHLHFILETKMTIGFKKKFDGMETQKARNSWQCNI